jgi:hypothetical protein
MDLPLAERAGAGSVGPESLPEATTGHVMAAAGLALWLGTPMSILPRSLVLLFLPLSSLLAQAGQFTTVASGQTGLAGLQEEGDGTLLGLGADYKVHFHADQFQFVPYLGVAAPRDLPLGMITTHVGRGELVPVGAATRERGDLRVDYVRPQCIERLEIRPEAMKQSFVFTQLPPGNGDLVVRTAIATELQPDRAWTGGALELTFPGAGGITISEVVGIDANGRRATGSMRCEGGHLDFVLPADFVASAALPLVLDPFLTTTTVISSTAFDERDPQIARVGSTQVGPGVLRSCIVWRRTVSAANHDLHAIRFTDTGIVSGALIGVETTTADANHARIGANQDLLIFLIVWEQNGNLMGKRIESVLVSTAMTMRDTADTLSSPDITGGLTGSSSITVVWVNETQNRIENDTTDLALSVQVLGGAILVSGNSLFQVSSPAVSRDLSTLHPMLTWAQRNVFLGVVTLRAATFHRGSSVIGPAVSVASGVNTDFNQNVAGDGRLWLVAYEHDTASAHNLSCRPVRTVDVSAVELGAPRLLASGPLATSQPDVTFLEDSAVVAWARANGTDFDVVMRSVDPVTGLDCEGHIDVDIGGNGDDVAICSCRNTYPVSERGKCQLAWVALNGASGTIAARRYESVDGDQSFPANVSCHPNGSLSIYGTSARVGNAGFGFQLHRATPGELTFALVSLGTAGGSLPCGSCTVIPDTINGVIEFTGATDTVGGARFPLAIPNNPTLANVVVNCQFAMFGTNCLSNFNLGPAVRATLQQ